jgi:hypothetical protein
MDWVFDDAGRPARYKDATGDCAVRAVAVALEISYHEAHPKLSKANRAWFSREKVSNGTKHWATEDVLRAAGWEEVWLGHPVRLRVEELEITGRVVVFVPEHMVALIDGTVHDVWDSRREPILSAWRAARPSFRY